MRSSTSPNPKPRQGILNSAHRQQCVSRKIIPGCLFQVVLKETSGLLILESPSSPERTKASISRRLGDYPTVDPDIIARDSARMSRNFLPGGSIPSVTVSPFILHLLYRCSIILSDPSRESSTEDTNSLAILQEAMKLLRQRWVASGEALFLSIKSSMVLNNMVLGAYLEILTARKAMLEI
jgi:hypothetical protein